MTDTERRTAAARFAADWKGRGDEKQETSIFWLALLQKVYGVEEPEKYVSFKIDDGDTLCRQGGVTVFIVKLLRVADLVVEDPLKWACA